MGGPVDHVAADFTAVVTVGAELSLSINVSKCELTAHLQINDSLLNSFVRVAIPNAVLLDASLFQGPSLDSAWSDRCGELKQPSTHLNLSELRRL